MARLHALLGAFLVALFAANVQAALYESSAYFAGKNCTGSPEFIHVHAVTDGGNATTCAEHEKVHPPTCETDADGHTLYTTCTDKLELVVPNATMGQFGVGTVYDAPNCPSGKAEEIFAFPTGACTAIDDDKLSAPVWAKADCAAGTFNLYSDAACTELSNITGILTNGTCAAFPLFHPDDSMMMTCKMLGVTLYESSTYYSSKNCTGPVEFMHVHAMTDGGNATTCAEHEKVHPPACEIDTDGHSFFTKCTDKLELVVPNGTVGQFGVGTVFDAPACPAGKAEEIMGFPTGACTVIDDPDLPSPAYAKVDCATNVFGLYTDTNCTKPAAITNIPANGTCAPFPLFHTDDSIQLACKQFGNPVVTTTKPAAGARTTAGVLGAAIVAVVVAILG